MLPQGADFLLRLLSSIVAHYSQPSQQSSGYQFLQLLRGCDTCVKSGQLCVLTEKGHLEMKISSLQPLL